MAHAWRGRSAKKRRADLDKEPVLHDVAQQHPAKAVAAAPPKTVTAWQARAEKDEEEEKKKKKKEESAGRREVRALQLWSTHILSSFESRPQSHSAFLYRHFAVLSFTYPGLHAKILGREIKRHGTARTCAQYKYLEINW